MCVIYIRVCDMEMSPLNEKKNDRKEKRTVFTVTLHYLIQQSVILVGFYYYYYCCTTGKIYYLVDVIITFCHTQLSTVCVHNYAYKFVKCHTNKTKNVRQFSFQFLLLAVGCVLNQISQLYSQSWVGYINSNSQCMSPTSLQTTA